MRILSPQTFLLTLFAIVAMQSSVRTEEPTAKPASSKESATPAQESKPGATYLLRYKLKGGEVLRYKVSHYAKITTTMADTRNDTAKANEKTDSQVATTHSDSVKSWKILDDFPNGDVQFSHVVESLHMKNVIDDKDPIEYDSTKDKFPPQGFEQVANAVGVTLTIFRMTPAGVTISREEKHPQPGNEDGVSMIIPMPKEAIAIGSTWDEPHQTTVDIGQGETRAIKARRHFELTKVDGDIATIKVTYQVLSPIDARMESQLVQKLTEGTIKFDIARGRITAQQQDVDRRVVGFAGAASGMHFRSRFTEILMKDEPEVAKKEDELKK